MTNQDFSPALFTDMYQLTMAQAYWESGTTAWATFSLFFRSYPPDRAYFVLAGVQEVLEYLESFHFSDSDVGHLESLGRFRQGFLRYLSGLRFTGSVRAMDEGAIFFADEFIEKPFSYHRLITTLEDTLRRSATGEGVNGGEIMAPPQIW